MQLPPAASAARAGSFIIRSCGDSSGGKGDLRHLDPGAARQRQLLDLQRRAGQVVKRAGQGRRAHGACDARGGLSHLVGHLWAEAWKAADSIFDPERQTFQRERAEHEQLRAEKDQEIARLEAELSRVEAERESARAALTKAAEDLERERVERAKAESTAGTLQAELTEPRDEKRKTMETVTAWVERASRAEARLEELAKGVGGHRS